MCGSSVFVGGERFDTTSLCLPFPRYKAGSDLYFEKRPTKALAVDADPRGSSPPKVLRDVGLRY
jgi:hypothetical protein